MAKITTLAGLLACSLLFASCAHAAGGRSLMQDPEVSTSTGDICSEDANTAYDCLLENPDYSILVDLIDAAGLTKTFQGKAQELTIFAPNDALLEAALEAVGNGQNITAEEFLAAGGADVLSYHVANQKVAYGFLPKGTPTYTQMLNTLLPGHGLTVNIDNPATGNGKAITTVVAELNKAIASQRTVKGKVALYAVDAVLLPNLPAFAGLAAAAAPSTAPMA